MHRLSSRFRHRLVLRHLVAAGLILAAGANARANAFRCEDVFKPAASVFPSVGLALTPLKEAGKTSPFIQVSHSAKVNLKDPFSTYFEDNFSSFVIDQQNYDGNRIVRGLNLGFIIQRNPVSPGGVEMVYEPVRANDYFPTPKIHFSTVTKAQREILEELYQSYAHQGDEVSSGIDRYRQQDERKRKRTTHFLLTDINRQPVAHLQALQKGRGRLNVEDEFSFRITGSRKIFELGRFRILNDERTADIAQRYGGNPKDRMVLQLLLYQKLFAWLNADVGAEGAVMYVNENMRRVLQHRTGVMKFDDVVPLKESPEDQKEYALVITKENLLRTEENVVRALLLRRLKFALASGQDPFLEMHFRPNERRVLYRLGILSFKKGEPGLVRAGVREILDNEVNLTLGFDRRGIEAAIRTLESD